MLNRGTFLVLTREYQIVEITNKDSLNADGHTAEESEYDNMLDQTTIGADTLMG
jgi:hypothetical protein